MSSLPSLSIKEEITSLSDALVLAQSRLLQLAKRVEQQDQETENWKTRYANLEVAYKEVLTSAKWLRVQNAELERKIINHKPEVSSVLSAREDAFQKLKHARKVIRDLLDERTDMKSPVRQEDIDEALFEEFQRENSPSTDSGKTVRMTAALLISTNASTSQLLQEGQESGPDRALTSRSASEDSLNVESEYSVSPLSPSASQISSQTSEEQPPKSRGPPWRIHFKKPPGTSVVTDGPLSLSTLESDLNMDDGMMISLQSLAVSSAFGMRFQILRLHSEKNVACLYDPIFIETREQSYILDWGYRQTNEDMRKYIKGHNDIDPVFHTFTRPLQAEGWFYIGAQHWSVVDFETIWPLDRKSRKTIIRKLVKRSKGKVNETEVARLLDSGQLVQFCVELSAEADISVSLDFSQDVLGYRTPPHRHDRRVEGVKE